MSSDTRTSAPLGDPSVPTLSGDTEVFPPIIAAQFPVGGNANGNPISGEVSTNTPGGGAVYSRRVKRITETQEIQIRTTHKRRKIVTRSGVLAGFGLAMIVYPVMGNVVTYANTAEQVPGVVLGEAPNTGHALLGDGPALIPSDLPLPSVDDQAELMAMSQKYQVSQHLPDCLPQESYTQDNGRLTEADLCTLWDGNVLRADAALALAELNAQFRSTFGRDLCIVGGYRSYEQQVATKRARGYLAAQPGKSMHGYGLAIDLCDSDYQGAKGQWLQDNAGVYEWENPYWARTRLYEPWHWEFYPGVRQYQDSENNWWGDGENDVVENPATTTDPAPTETTDPAQPDPVVTPNPTPAPGAAG